jgi:hypothetical protein
LLVVLLVVQVNQATTKLAAEVVLEVIGRPQVLRLLLAQVIPLLLALVEMELLRLAGQAQQVVMVQILCFQQSHRLAAVAARVILEMLLRVVLVVAALTTVVAQARQETHRVHHHLKAIMAVTVREVLALLPQVAVVAHLPLAVTIQTQVKMEVLVVVALYPLFQVHLLLMQLEVVATALSMVVMEVLAT